jgi:hypothetical protein
VAGQTARRSGQCQQSQAYSGLILAASHGFIINMIIFFYIQKFKVMLFFELVCRNRAQTGWINNTDQHAVLAGRMMKSGWDICGRYVFNPRHFDSLSFVLVFQISKRFASNLSNASTIVAVLLSYLVFY